MADEWREMPFSSAVLLNPSVQLIRGREYAFVDMDAVKVGSRWAHANGKRVFEGSGSRFQNGDTLMARITPCLENGKIACFKADDGVPLAHGSTELIVIRGRPGVTEPRFAYYLAQSPAVRGYAISQMTGTSGRQRVPVQAFDHLTVRIPPLYAQRAIAHILGTLDDKIELNRQMNETLEAMAQALFKSWFIDFDPVHAKAEGRDTGLSPDVAALFPDSFEDSDLGEIPKGWIAVPIGSVANTTIGGDWGEDTAASPGAVEAVCLRGVDLEYLRKSGWADAPRRWFSVSSIQKRSLCARDVLIAGSGAGPTGRSLWAAPELDHVWGLPVVYSNFCKRLRCNSEALAVYIDRCLSTMRDSGEIWEYVNGTSVPNLDVGALLSGKVVVLPEASVLREFAGIIKKVSSRLLSPESCALATLRNTLLPELLSGDLRVKDVQHFEEAAS